MRIKKVEISGFKSFVDRTVMNFPDAVTAIVGPNGCGKSNIVDAMRWVMGEQSAKQLRGRGMDDVIFAGSDSRGPAGMAEVSLTFDGTRLPADAAPGGVPWGAAGPEAVVVTRRIHRGGESEYLLGGVPCRLRDVVDFFLGSGVGAKEAYAIIEQGRIGFIVSSRPEDRRALIDEAAGITKYKGKKKLAERRMEATRQHLLRVSDIIGEIESRLRSLRLQAQKAERYKRYKSDLQDLELWAAAHKFLGFLVEEKSLQAARDLLAEGCEREGAAVRTEELVVEAERMQVIEESADLEALKEQLFALSHRAQLAAQRTRHYQDEAAALEGRAASARAEIGDLETRLTGAAGAVEARVQEIVTLDLQTAMCGDQLRELEAACAATRGELAAAREALEAANASSSARGARTARLEADIRSCRARQEDLAARIEALRAEQAALSGELAQGEAQRAAIEARATALSASWQEGENRLAAAEARAAALRDQVGRGELELETLREEMQRRKSRLQSLMEIETRYESFQRGVRAIMQTVREPEGQDTVGRARPWSMASGVRGLVADIVQPPPELETALEAVLGERLGNIIVASHEVGVEAVEFLKTGSEGRSSFIPVGVGAAALAAPAAGTVVYDALAAGAGQVAASGAETAAPTPWPSGDGVRGPMLDLIGYDRRYHRVAAYLLGDVLVVEDLRRAIELWRSTRTDKTIVTLDGDVVDPHGTVTGGSREAAVGGVLGQRREIRELEELVTGLEHDLRESLARHLDNKRGLADELAAIAAQQAATRRDEVERVACDKDRDHVARERAQAAARRDRLHTSEEELRLAAAENHERLVADEAALGSERAQVTEAEARLAALRAEVAALCASADLTVASLTDGRLAASRAEAASRAAHEALDRLRAEQQDQRERLDRLRSSLGEDLARAATLRADASRIGGEAALQQAEADERASAHAERRAALEERQEALSRRDADLRAARGSLASLGQELVALDLRRQEARLRRTGLEAHVRDRFPGTALASVVFDYHLRPPVGEQEDARTRELRSLIERMGEVNLTTIEESDELQKRYDFLTGQRADLEAALTQLATAIERLNRASRRKFREVFNAINDKFKETFPSLFGGGRAQLALTDERDLLETGVEIVANPPGKKVMQSLDLLSGGEKALTAVALLFAIFLVKPSPFCLLDEVDAPLDEANVDRFNQMVRAMTDRSQFILITHNQRTMEIADRLCGVTMEEPGVSKLVAVNLRTAPK